MPDDVQLSMETHRRGPAWLVSPRRCATVGGCCVNCHWCVRTSLLGRQRCDVNSGKFPGCVAEGMPEPSAGYQMFEAASYIAGVVLGIWLIVAGSGAAGGRAWGLTMLRGWAVIRIIVAIIVLVGFFYWLDETVRIAASVKQSQVDQAIAAGGEAADIPSLTPSASQLFLIGWFCLQAVAVSIWPLIVLITTRRRGEA